MANSDEIEVLEQAYADVMSERDRLRDARAGFTSRLGPLPASAAIVIGLAGSAAGKVNAWWLVEAAVLLALLIFIGTVYSGLRPYRLMRASHQRDFEPGPAEASRAELGFGVKASDRATWLRDKLRLEEQLYGPLRKRQRLSLSLKVENMQDALDVERAAFFVVQALFAEIIFVLVAGLAMRGVAFPVQAGVGAVFALATAVGLVVARRRRNFLEGLLGQQESAAEEKASPAN